MQQSKMSSAILLKIAKKVGTPTYVYSKQAIINRIQTLKNSLEGLDCEVYFAVKACSNVNILKIFKENGVGVDLVSGGELYRALLAGVSPKQMVFSGVGKTKKEIDEALKAQIHMFNVESLQELFVLDKCAAKLGVRARVALRINPNVNAKTHPYISTGLKKNKFGFSSFELNEVFKYTKQLKHVHLCGLSCHIGSQILKAAPFVSAWQSLRKTAAEVPFEVTYLDLGGGLGISYGKEKSLSLSEYGGLIQQVFKGSHFKLGIEPGRSLIGPTAVLLSQLLSIKKRQEKFFYIVDAAMNDLMRPALYKAVHPVESLTKTSSRAVSCDIVGPVCETTDTFQTNARMPLLKPGALLAFTNVGAYGMSMASQYNSRPLVAEVLVEGQSYKVIRKREEYADLVQKELI